MRGADGRVTDYVANFRCPGVIKRISAPDTKDGRRKLGVGHVYIHYDELTKGWLQANNRPTFYNNMSKAGGWRLVGPDVRMDDDDDDDDGAIDGEVFDADDDADDEESDDDDDDDAGGV